MTLDRLRALSGLSFSCLKCHIPLYSGPKERSDRGPFFRIHHQVGPRSLVCPQNSLNPTTRVWTWPHLPQKWNQVPPSSSPSPQAFIFPG